MKQADSMRLFGVYHYRRPQQPCRLSGPDAEHQDRRDESGDDSPQGFRQSEPGVLGRDDDVAFCREITEKAKVCAVPISAFYHPSQDDRPRQFARFCFCKKFEVLDEAAQGLKAYFS